MEIYYWLGRTWLKLKEYRNARETFERITTAKPKSIWYASAQYYQGSRNKLELIEVATKRLEDLIRSKSDTGTSEAAKELLADLQENL